MGFPRTVNGSEDLIYITSATENESKIGQKMVVEDGRIFRYTLAGAFALVAALLNQGAIPEVAKYGDQACATVAAGATIIGDVAAATTDMPVNDLINGYVWSEQTTQLGPAARVKDNKVITQGASTGEITLHNPLSIAIAAADTVSYIRNTWRNTIVYPTTATGQVAGVTVSAIATTAFGWLQTGGPAKVQTSDTPALTAPVIAEGTAAGELTIGTAATDIVVGYFMSWEQADEDGLFFLTIE